MFRLLEAGPNASSVIAKRTLASALATERLVYEKVMPGLPLESPEFYGYAEDGEKAWIFLEDVGDRRFSETDPEQRTAAARWLGAMHVSASELEVVQNLPKIGPDRYLDHLRSARGKIVDNLDNPALDRRDAELLAAVVGQLDTIEGSWPKLENLCDTIPNSLVHADFQSKNAYVRERDGVPGLLLIDWETAGMGPLAPDLAPIRGRQWKPRIDLAAYSSITRERWPDLDAEGVRRLVGVGGVLQQIAAIDWACSHLSHAWPERATATLRRYAPDIEQVMASLR